MNSGRFSGRVESTPDNYLLSTGDSHPSANDSLDSRRNAPARVTAAAARRIEADLTDLDRAIIEALANVRIATGQQLRRLFWPDTDTGRRLARHRLAKLTNLRVLTRLDRRIGGVRAGSEGYTYSLDVVCERIAEPESSRRRRRPRTPGTPFLTHALAVTETFVQLHETHHQGALELLSFQAEPTCWRRYPNAGGGKDLIKPDAFAITAVGEFEYRWLIEVDCATEHSARIVVKARQYVEHYRSGTEQHAHGVYPWVLWIAPTEARSSVLVKALGSLPAEYWELFQVTTTASFPEAVTKPGDISQREQVNQ
jgi:hypothetical protein